jgi:hypothetical protein
LKALRERNWTTPPIDPDSIDAVLLTHAHLDHTGYLPALARDGFSGAASATPATCALSGILLPDSGHLQEEEANYANRKGFSKHSPALALYTEEDARRCLRLLKPLSFDSPSEVAPGVHATFRRAGHILGVVRTTLSCAARRRSRKPISSSSNRRTAIASIRTTSAFGNSSPHCCAPQSEAESASSLHSPSIARRSSSTICAG